MTRMSNRRCSKSCLITFSLETPHGCYLFISSNGLYLILYLHERDSHHSQSDDNDLLPLVGTMVAGSFNMSAGVIPTYMRNIIADTTRNDFIITMFI